MKRMLYFIVGVLFPVTTYAQTVTYQFSGVIDTVTRNDNGVFPEGHPGQAFGGWFSYTSESRTTEQGSVAFTLGTLQSQVIDDRCVVGMINNTANYRGSYVDYLSFFMYDNDGEFNYSRTGLVFADYSRTVFNSGDPLPMFLSLSMFDIADFSISGNKGTNYFVMDGHLTDLTLVPEPATLSLLAMGGVLIRRKKQSA